eukprot:796602-Prymnesium_polylepis.1
MSTRGVAMVGGVIPRPRPPSLAQFHEFAWEHPEVVDKSTFFCTRHSSYDTQAELTVVYGASYKRSYSTWGHVGTPLKYHVPHDTWADGVWSTWAQWPQRCPGWFNFLCQPQNRPAFRFVEGGEVDIAPDLGGVVKARKRETRTRAAHTRSPRRPYRPLRGRALLAGKRDATWPQLAWPQTYLLGEAASWGEALEPPSWATHF